MLAEVFSLLFFAFYLFSKLTIGRTKSQTCLVGKTAIITGGNDGIGYQVAVNLACRGCKVIIADKNNSNNSQKTIFELTNNPNISFKYLDLTSFKSIRLFARKIVQEEERLDFLINNAGVGASENKYTEDGLHPLMQCNTFGHFLLTHLLIDLLKRSTASRVIFTSSLMAFTHNLNLNNLNYPAGHPNNSYTNCIIFSNANLCNIILCDIFAEKLKDANITVNSVHPGMTDTKIFDNFFTVLNTPKISQILWKIFMACFAKNIEDGAQTTIHLTVAKELDKVTGYYFWDCIKFPKPKITQNQAFCKQVWLKCEEFVCLENNEKLFTAT